MNIIFDYGGVLGSDATVWRSDDYTDFSSVLRLADISLEDAKRIWQLHWPHLKKGKEGVSSFWDDFARSGKSNVRSKTLAEEYNACISGNEKMLSFCAHLRKRGVPLYILANEAPEWMRVKEAKFNLPSLFEKIYCSGDLGLAKPEAGIFKHVLFDLKVPAEEIVFIDNQEGNVKAAVRLGMRTVLFTDLRQLRADMDRFLRSSL